MASFENREQFWAHHMAEEAKRIEEIHSRLEVRDFGEMGRGVVSLVDIEEVGSLVIVGKPRRISPVRTDMSFQTNWDLHVDLDDPAERVNHGCGQAANLGLRINEYGGYNMYARTKIEKDKPLLWCYPTTEYKSIAIEGKQCLCQSPDCMHEVRGWEEMPVEMRRQFLQEGYVGPHILALEKSRGVLI